jgi:Zn-finger nucleic acid-binding protein
MADTTQGGSSCVAPARRLHAVCLPARSALAPSAVKRARRDSDRPGVKLVACPDCHAQYDVSTMVDGAAFDCRCGTSLEAVPLAGIDAAVQRCSACGAVAREEDESCDYCGSAIQPRDRRGGLICPECMARNLEDARFCLACGVAFSPQDVAHDVGELRCPGCEKWMCVSEVGGLVVQECPKCHGLWAAEDVFDSLVDRATSVARERALGGPVSRPRVDGANPAARSVEYRRCPVCDDLMVRRNFRRRSGVIIDRCHSHGTWLDAHELEQIAGFVLSGRAAEADRAEADEAGRRIRARASAAAFRTHVATAGVGESSFTIFGDRRERSAVSSILDLLSALLH